MLQYLTESAHVLHIHDRLRENMRREMEHSSMVLILGICAHRTMYVDLGCGLPQWVEIKVGSHWPPFLHTPLSDYAFLLHHRLSCYSIGH